MARQLLNRTLLLAVMALAAAVVAVGWKADPQPDSDAAGWSSSAVAVPASAGARLPRLVAHPEDGAVLSWVEPAPEGGHLLRVARYRDGRFAAPVEVARGRNWFVNWGDFPSVVPITTNFWLAHWLVRHPLANSPYHYGIAMAGSSDDGQHWTHRPPPHADVGPAEHGFAAIAALDDRAVMVWLDGRANDARHSFALRSTDIERDGAATAETVVDGDVCSCCWPALARTQGNLWLAYRSRTADEIRDFQLRHRTAAGWSAPIALAGEGWRIAGCPTNGVSLAAQGERLAAAWFTAADGVARVRVAFIRDGMNSLESIHDVDAATPVGRAAIAWLDSERVAVLHIAASSNALANLQLTLLSQRGIERRLTLTQLPANRDSGVPQLLAVDGELLVAWTAAAPGYGIRLLRVAQRALL